jgi:hypothetical protein
MALPTPDSLKNMEYAFQGQPFVNVPAKSGIVLSNMEYAFQGQPFVGNESGGGVVTAIKTTSISGKLVAAGMI